MKAISPRTLGEAVERLASDPSLVPVAGCTDLMVREPLEIERLSGVLDLLQIPELQGIRAVGGGVEIGAATTFTDIRESKLIRADFPALAAAASEVGGWQIQNRATLGGNIANASPAGDSLPVLLALDARVEVVGAGGERQVPYTDFHLGYRKTAVREGEIITRVLLQTPLEGTRQGFRKIGTRRAQAISKVVVCEMLRVERGRIADFSLAAGSVAPVPVRLATVEEAVVGLPAESETARLAGRLAAEAVEPIDDVRSTAAYRRFALAGVVRRLTLDLTGE